MKKVIYKMILAEPGRNKCSSCAKKKKDYFEKRELQHQVLQTWLMERFGEEIRIVRSDGKTAVVVVEAREGLKGQLESAPDVIEVR